MNFCLRVPKSPRGLLKISKSMGIHLHRSPIRGFQIFKSKLTPRLFGSTMAFARPDLMERSDGKGTNFKLCVPIPLFRELRDSRHSPRIHKIAADASANLVVGV